MSVKDDLIPNEGIVFESKKHWIAPVRDSVIPVLLIVGAGLLGWISPDGEGIFGAVGTVLDWIRLGMFLVGVGWIIYNVVVWRTAEFAVTNLRVVREEGLVSKRSSATLLTSVSDVKSNVGIVGKSLGYGDLEIYTQSGDAGVDRFTSITEPIAFRNALMERKMSDAQGGGAAGGRPAPAPIAAAPAQAAPVAPEPVAEPPAAFAPAAPSAAESAETLARLADLRDSGAITAEEYDAKKAEILARM